MVQSVFYRYQMTNDSVLKRHEVALTLHHKNYCRNLKYHLNAPYACFPIEIIVGQNQYGQLEYDRYGNDNERPVFCFAIFQSLFSDF